MKTGLPVFILVVSVLLWGCDKVTELERLVEIRDFYDRSYINNNIARGSTFFGTDRYRFISYFDNEGRVVILRRDLRAGVVVEDRLDDVLLERRNNSASLLNPHNFISGGLDAEGHIHLLFGAHNSRPRHYVSGEPLQLVGWREIGGWMDRLGHSITYPYLLRVTGGALWLFYRNGHAGNGGTYLLRGLVGSPDAWRPQLLIDGAGENSQYLFSPASFTDGCVHLAWTWRLSDFTNPSDNPYLREPFQGVTNRDIAYGKSCDGGRSWSDSNGRVRELPMVRLGPENRCPETIAEIDIGTGFFNHYGSDLDAAGRPHYVLQLWDAERHTQVWHLYLSREGWELQPVTRYSRDIPWNRHHGNGLAATALARPELLVDRDTDSVLIITRSQHHGNRLELYRAQPPYREWRLELVDTGSLGGWEPQVDKGLFHAWGRIVVLLNAVRDEPAYEGFDLALNPESREILARRERGETIVYPDYSILYPRTPPPLSMDELRFARGEAWIAELHLSP